MMSPDTMASVVSARLAGEIGASELATLGVTRAEAQTRITWALSLTPGRVQAVTKLLDKWERSLGAVSEKTGVPPEAIEQHLRTA